MIEQRVLGQSGCDNWTGGLNPSALPGSCEEVEITTACLPAGTYYFFMAPQSGSLVDCYGAQNAYCATLECMSPCELWCPCPGNMTGYEDTRDGLDIQMFVDCLLDPDNGPGKFVTYGCKCADIDNDGDAEINDIVGFVALLLDDSGYCYQGNDLCANATVVDFPGAPPYVQMLTDQTTIGAEPDCPFVLGWNAVWYKIMVP